MDKVLQLKKDGKSWGIFLICYLLFFQIGTMVVALITGLVFFLLRINDYKDVSLYLASDFMQIFAAQFFVLYYLKNKKEIKEQQLLGKNRKVSTWFKCLAFVIGINSICSIGEMIFHELTGCSLGISNILDTTTINPMLVIVLVAVFPAIVEELMFRGVLYRSLRKYGSLFAAITSSILFGLLHMNFLQLIFATGMGIVLCYLYEQSGKLRYGILIHLINNAMVCVYQILGLKKSIVILEAGIAFVFFIVILYLAFRRRIYTPEIWMNQARICKQDMKSFFLTIPMMLFVSITLAVCVVFISVGVQSPI